MTKIFLDGAAFADRSLGTRAMSIGTTMILNKCTQNAEFSILSAYPQIERRRCKRWNFDVRIVKRQRSFLAAVPALLTEYLRADIIVGVYADAFVGKSHLQCYGLLSKLYIDFIVKLLLVTLTRKPLVVFPCSLGPFQGRLTRLLVRLLLNRAKVIMVREELSKRYLVEIGIDRALIHEVPDVAFILPEASAERINEVFFRTKVQGVLIGINVSQLLNFESKGYADLMADVADYLSTNLGATVLLIPHEIRQEKGNELDPPSDPDNDAFGGDDITAVRTVYEKVKEKQRVIPISEHEVDVMKGIIGRCELFIGARTHSIISALSMGIPTLGIAYSQKTPGIMKMVGLGNYVCSFRTITFEELIPKINDLFSKRSGIRRHLLSQVEILQKRVWAIGDIVQNYVPSA